MKAGTAEGGRLTEFVILAAVMLASALFVLGLILFLVQGGRVHPLQGHTFWGLVGDAWRDALRLRPIGFIEAGLLVLLLAPLLRLIAGVVQSARGRDWRFVVVGIAVAVLLLAGIFLGTA